MLDGGYGYYRNEEGRLVRKPQSCGTVIDKDVEIGLNTIIDRGSYRDTFIGEGTKIDNLCHIGHNAIIHKHVIIVAHTVIGGSAEIGDYSYIGMGSLIKDHVKIGKHCLIGMGSVVTKDVPDNTAVKGNPAKPFKPNLKPEDLYAMVALKTM